MRRQKVNRKLLPIFVIVTILLIAVPAAQAITFGQPDGDDHPNVGVMLVDLYGDLYMFCSGSLIAPDVFLTASHCTVAAAAYGAAPDDVYVSFDPVIDENATLYHGVYDINPNYGHDMHDLHDVAVITLDAPVPNITPAQLPPAGLLDQMKKDHTLKDARFVTVGYGGVRDDKTKGPQSILDNDERRYAEQSFLALKPFWIQLSMNPSTGSGGTCYGDSGGPHFLGDSDVVVSLTVTGDTPCRATDVTYRLDTESARSYLSQFVELP
jgi:secreted trypsin-like serine protease